MKKNQSPFSLAIPPPRKPRRHRLKGSLSAAVLASLLMTGALHAQDLPDLIIDGTEYSPSGDTDTPPGPPDRYEKHDTVTLSNDGSITPGADVYGGGMEVSTSFTASSGTIGAIVLTGNADFFKTGDGTVSFSGIYDLAGNTTIQAGTLEFSGALFSSPGIVTIDSGGTFRIVADTELTPLNPFTPGSSLIENNGELVLAQKDDTTVILDQEISGFGNLIQEGGLNSLTILEGTAKTYFGETTVHSGTLRTTADDMIASSYLLHVEGSTADFDVAGSHQFINGEVHLVSGRLGDSSGTSHLDRTGSLAADGGFYLEAGEVDVRLTERDGSTTNLFVDGDSAANLLTINHQNTIEGAVFVWNGTLRTTLDNAFATSEGLVIESAGAATDAVFDLAGTDQAFAGHLELLNGVLNDSVGGGSLIINSGDFYLGNGEINANLTGTGDLLGIGGPGEVMLLNVRNDYTGDTIIASGTIRTTVDHAFANSTGLALWHDFSSDLAVLDLNGTEQSLKGEVELIHGTITGGGQLTAPSYLLKSGTVDTVLAGDASVDLVKANWGPFPNINTEVVLLRGNTYEGHTYVHEGTLIAGADDVIAASSGLTVENSRQGVNTIASFDVNGHDVVAKAVRLVDGSLDDASGGDGSLESQGDFVLESGEVNVNLAGNTHLVKETAGTVHLNVANTYEGITFVHNGTLSLHADGALPGNHVALNRNGRIDLNGTTQQIAGLHNGWLPDNTLADTGGVVDLGDADLDEYGILEVGEGSALSSFNGVITGSGEMHKAGEGTFLLPGLIATSGPTRILGGELRLIENDGFNIAGDVAIDRSGVLSGTGLIGGSVLNEGLVAPGVVFSPDQFTGTIAIGGNYRQAESGAYRVDIADRRTHNRLLIGGEAHLGGTLVVVHRAGYTPYRNDRFRILRAEGGREGRFGSVFNNFGNTMLEFTLRYNPKSVWVVVNQRSFADLGGLTPNQRQVGKALDHAAARNQIDSVFEHLNYTDVSNVPALLTEISPEQLTSIFTISAATSQLQNVNLERRLDDVRNGSTGFSASGLALQTDSGTLRYDGAPIANTADGLTLAGWDGGSIVSKEVIVPVVEQSRWGFFATGHGEWANIKSTGNAQGQEFTSAGFTLGADYRVSENFVVGIHGGYTNTEADLAHSGHLEVDGGRGGLYASAFGGGAYVNAAIGGGYNSYRTKRHTLGGYAHGDSDGGEFNALLGLGYDHAIGGFSIGPVGSLQYTYTGLNSFEETGSDAPLHFKSQHADSLRTLVGVKLAGAIEAGSVVIRPEVRAQWKHEYLDSTPGITSRFRGADAYFTVDAPDMGRDSLVLDAGAAVEFNRTVSVFAYYTGELGRKNYDSHSVNGGFRIAF